MSEQRGLSLPAEPPQAPGLPENFVPVAFEQFTTLNTKPARAAIADGEMSWCHGWMPIAENTLRTLYGKGTAIITAGANTIVWFGFGNIGATKYCAVLKTDGSLTWVNTDTMAFGTILSAGGITNPRTIFGFSQWGSQFLIFASDQTNGYWLWDGTSTYSAGTIAPFVALTNSGSNYTSSPTITLHTTGAGTGATFSSSLSSNTVGQVNVTNPGSGFGVNDFATVTFSGGGSDAQAVATANITAAAGVLGVTVTNPGSGYTFKAVGAFSGGGGSGATAVLNIQNGFIVSVAITTPGTGYTSVPTFTVTDAGYSGIAGGSGFANTVTVASQGITSYTVNSGGSGYDTVPTVNIVGDGVGAQATAVIAGGVLSSIFVVNPGQGYTVALVQILGGNNAANANITLMPFGISGTSVEINQQHVWVSNGGAVATFPPRGRVIFSAPGNPADFNPGDGAGAFLAVDSFTRVGYYSLKQSNGFLYMIGDSSINYISGVSTTSTPATSTTPAGPPITNFGNQNVDPQLGTSWPSSVQVFSRNIVFANTIGVFISYGGAVTKISEPLDGFFTSGAIFGANANFSAAVASVFGIPVYMLLLPIIDPTTGNPTNALLMWTGKKWFTCTPDIALTYVATQEINSVLTAYGTDGTSIVPLFAQPSAGVSKSVQSKLFSTPAYWTTKTAVRLHAVVKVINNDHAALNVRIDNEVAQGSGNAFIALATVGNANVDVLGPVSCGQAGRMMGVTLQTTAQDMELLSIGLSEQVESTNV